MKDSNDATITIQTMTDDQKKKYEEAAKEHLASLNNDFVRSVAKSAFLAGATHAENEAYNSAIEDAKKKFRWSVSICRELEKLKKP